MTGLSAGASAVVEGAPGWLLTVLGAMAVAVVLATVAWVVVRCRAAVGGWTRGIGAQAVVALGGVAVSVHGLWGFATDTAGLNPLLATAFIGVFDAAEMVLLVMLYRAADPKVGWTAELRLMHRTAWTLVAFSMLMNAIHAPNWWSRPVLAAIPALATWLIELQLRSKLGTNRPGQEEDEAGRRPGPMRLVLLLWQRAWSGIFAALGLNAHASSSGLARAALVQRAAVRLYRLRLALAAGVRPRRVRALRRRAQSALDRADVATDRGQSLALARRLAVLVRADEVARLDYRSTRAVMEMVEELSVTDAAAADAAASRADRAEAARQRSEDARQEAERARQRSADELAVAQAALDEIRERQERARQDAAAAEEEAEAARQRSASARQEAERARQRSADAQQHAQAAESTAARQARQTVRDLEGEAERLRGAITELEGAARQAQREARDAQHALAQVTSQTVEAQVVRDRLLGELAQHAGDHDPAALAGAGPLFQSEAKQAGWEDYYHRLDTSAGQDELTSADLAARYGVAPSNARNWIRDFRAARAAQLTERAEQVAERAERPTEHQPSAERSATLTPTEPVAA
ncbi:hypothetical protein [Streptomyces sp. AJS327]|uniref:hypothetical protein n=1 Tax=Streptomyces sp. AJS327 TaxID=2545265 RepID=UPI0015DDC93A|nr:hypothetical protein [Streptomyces sp. AJS327]